MKKIFRILLALVLVLVVVVGGLLGWLSAVEYKPAQVETVEVRRAGDSAALKAGGEYTVLTWNVGYGGLGKYSDFFMDGGKNTKSADEKQVRAYLDGIAAGLDRQGADLVLLQEVDINSSRSYGIDQRSLLGGGMSSAAFALNYSCPFVPNPNTLLIHPLGKINSGLLTMADGFSIERAERIALPCPFSWPLRIANLKRCLLVSYLPVEGSDRQLVLVNLHLEAYDDGEGKIAQTEQLRAFIEEQYAKGNYVIAGGDFNQAFPGSLDVYPNTHAENWEPGVLDDKLLPAGWTLACDLSVPTCRLLNQPYDPADAAGTQYYVIDGLILSPNVTLKSVETLDEGFENADHNPVKLRLVLNEG